MPRPIIPALAVALLGLSLGSASAATLDDKADPAVDTPADDSAGASQPDVLPADTASKKKSAKGSKGSKGSSGAKARGPGGNKAHGRSGPAQRMARPGGPQMAAGARAPSGTQRSGSASSARAGSDRSDSSSSQRAGSDRSGSSSSQRAGADRSGSASSERTSADRSRSSASQRGSSSHQAANRDGRTDSARSREAAKRDHRTAASRPSHASSDRHRNPQDRHERVTADKRHREAQARNHRSKTRKVHHSRYAPSRWVPSYHRYHVRGVPHYSPRYWAAGVFYYNPPPKRHNVVVVESHNGKTRQVDSSPKRAVNRNGDFGIGMTAGSYMSGYEGGGGYGDMGLGLDLEYRPHEAIGLEFSWAHHSETWEDDTQRINNPMQLSANLYAFPWTRVSPYVTAGLTWNNRSINDDFYNGLEPRVASADDTLFGPHAGIGVELALGESAAINFEANYIGFLNQDDADLSVPTALQGTMGLGFYF